MKNGLTKAFGAVAKVIAIGAAALAVAGLGSVAVASNNNAPAQNASATSGVFNTSAGQIQLAGSMRGASNPPPGIRPGQCWHRGHGIGGGRAAMQWIDSWIVPCGSPGSVGPV
jgi:hypothetical protein